MSFRPKSTFTTLLYNNLTSNLWKSIKDSLLGSELISYAAEFLYQQEVLSDSIISSVYPSDKSGLMNLMLCGNFNNVAFSYFRPSSVTIKVDVQSPQLYEPFSLRLSKGNISYTNIDWVSSDNAITLYQGVPQVAFVNGGIQNRSRFQQVTTEFSASVYRTAGDSEYFSNVVKLDSLAYADSVYVYSTTKGDISWTTYQLYDSINAGEDACNYKLQWGTDVNLQVQFGNGLWGKTLQTNQEYYIYFLDATFNSVETDGLVLENALDSSTSRTRINYEVISFENYSVTTDVAYRNLKNALSKNSVIATKEQIEDFVNAYPLVADCAVSLNPYQVNAVDVYVKPSDDDIDDKSYYTDITEALQTYGEITTRYQIFLASPLKLKIAVTILDNVTEELDTVRSTIQGLVNSYFDGISIGDSVNFSDLSNMIYQETGYRNLVRYYVSQETVTDNQLVGLPVLSTIERLSSSTWNGTIENGILWKKAISTVTPVFDLLNPFGDFTVCAIQDANETALQYYVTSGDSFKSSTKTASFIFKPSSEVFGVSTERYVSNFALESDEASSTSGISKLNGLSLYYLENYGYYSNESENNFFDPNVGMLQFGSEVRLSNASTLLKQLHNGHLPILTSYKDAYYFVYDAGNTCNVVKVTSSGSVGTSVNIPQLSDISALRGIYNNDTQMILFSQQSTIAWVLNNYQNTLTPLSSTVTFSNTSVDTTKVVNTYFGGYSFGFDYGVFMSADSSLNSDGRRGVNVLNPNVSLTGTEIELKGLQSTSNYAMLCFTGNATLNTVVKYCLSFDSTVPAGAEIADDGLNKIIYDSVTDSTAFVKCVLVRQPVSSGTQTRIYLKRLSFVVDSGGHPDSIVWEVVPITINTTLPTYTLNVCKTPVYDGSTVTVEVETAHTIDNTTWFNPAQLGLDQVTSVLLNDPSCVTFHFIGKVEEDYYMYIDAPIFTTASKIEALSGGNRDVIGYSGFTMKKLFVKLNDSGVSLVSSMSELEKIGAFDSTGKLTIFSDDDSLGVDGNGDPAVLRVSYETQNAYFEVDNTRYAMLDEDGIVIKQ